MSDVPGTVTRAPTSGCPLAWSVTRPATVPCWARATALTPPASPQNTRNARSMERMTMRIRIPPSRWRNTHRTRKKPLARVVARRAWLHFPNERMRTRAQRQIGHGRCVMDAHHLTGHAFHLGTIVQLVSQARKRPKTSTASRNSASTNRPHTFLTIHFEKSTFGARRSADAIFFLVEGRRRRSEPSWQLSRCVVFYIPSPGSPPRRTPPPPHRPTPRRIG